MPKAYALRLPTKKSWLLQGAGFLFAGAGSVCILVPLMAGLTHIIWPLLMDVTGLLLIYYAYRFPTIRYRWQLLWLSLVCMLSWLLYRIV